MDNFPGPEPRIGDPAPHIFMPEDRPRSSMIPTLIRSPGADP